MPMLTDPLDGTLGSACSPHTTALIIYGGPPIRREPLTVRLTLIEITSADTSGGAEEFVAISHGEEILAVPATGMRRSVACRRIVAAASVRYRADDDGVLHAEESLSLKLGPSCTADPTRGSVLRLVDDHQALELPVRAIGPVLRQTPQVALVGAPTTATLH